MIGHRLENTPYYDTRVVIYERKCFIRLATGVVILNQTLY